MKHYLLCIAILLACPAITTAQRKSVELTAIEERLVRSIQEDSSNWTRVEVTPIEGSEDVSINKWSVEDRTVGITIIRYASEAESSNRIRQFAADLKAERTMVEDADEVFSLGQRNSITLRKRSFIVNVNVDAPDPSDQKQMLKRFAKLVLDAIKQ
ncbi:MAG TPA: hypothetical protein VMZ30_01145 [Pyrinomonadaceae bacterium]|nr:hypothetical protein [Pyrinomonadaceae bacterium]